MTTLKRFLTLLLISTITLSVWGDEVTAFNETFKNCGGTMGWSGSGVANGSFVADSTGWTIANASGAGGAAKFGTGSKLGYAQTPDINCGSSTTASLSFKAGAWNSNSESTNLKLSYTNCTGDLSSVTLSKGEWKSYTVSISNITGNIKIKFEGNSSSNSRFFLDDVVITYISATCTNSITITKGDNPAHGTFTINNSGSICIDAGNASTTVTATPESHYVLATVTSTGGGTVGDIEGNSCTITNISASTTINVSFAEAPKHTVTFKNNGAAVSTREVYSGEAVGALPSLTSGDKCDPTSSTFMGWTEEVISSKRATAPTYITAETTINTNKTYHAVWAKSGGGDDVTDVITRSQTQSYLNTTNCTTWASDFTLTGGSSGATYKIHSMGLTQSGSTTVPSNCALVWNTNGYLACSGAPTDGTIKLKSISITTTENKSISVYGSNTLYSAKPTSTSLGNVAATTDGGTYNLSGDQDYKYPGIVGASGTKVVSISITYGSTSYSDYLTSCGATINVENDYYVTSAQGEKVKIVIPIEATNFGTNSTLYASKNGSSFELIGWSNKSITAGEDLITEVVVQYQPSASNTTENGTITLTAAPAESKVINIHGRSLPPQFVIVAKDNGTWHALPANMSGAGTQPGVDVATDNDADPTLVTAAPYSTLYSLQGVHTDRYAASGTNVRFEGNNSKMLWGTEGNNTNINDATYAADRAAFFEWVLTTTDNVNYKFGNVGFLANQAADPATYTTNRSLKYYASSAAFGMYANGQENFRLLPVACGTRPTISAVAKTHEQITLTWTGAPATEYNVYIKQGGSEIVGLSQTNVSSPVTISGLSANETYTYILSPGTITDNCRVEGEVTTDNGPITVTLHRYGQADEVIVVPMAEQPYVFPSVTNPCDEWAYDGWSASPVAAGTQDATSYPKITETSVGGDFYAVYKNAGAVTQRYERITSSSGLSAGDKYLIVGYNGDTKYLMNSTYTQNNPADVKDGGTVGIVTLAEDGTNYYNKSTIDAHPECVYTITGAPAAWYISSESTGLYVNFYNYTWLVNSSKNGTFTIEPGTSPKWAISHNWSIDNGYSSEAYLEYYNGKFQLYSNSGNLMLYHLVESGSSYYTTNPVACVPCDEAGAQFTYPKMDKATSSADFTNPVVYTSKTNTSAVKSYTSSNTTVATVNPTTGVVHVVGLGETTITFTQGRDNVNDVCGFSISYDLVVTDPSLEIVEVTGDDKIIIEHDFSGTTSASILESETKLNGSIADSLFISKYFEAASHVKLFGLYNGTDHDVDLREIRVRSGSSTWGDHGYVTLKNIAKIGTDFPGYMMPPFTEIIFWTNREDGNSSQVTNCIDMKIDGTKYDYQDMKDNKIKGWYRVGDYDGGLDDEGNKSFNFNGDDALILERSTDGGTNWFPMDIFGAGNASGPYAVETGDGTATDNGKLHKFTEINDNPGGFYWIADVDEDGKLDTLSTNRFYLMRNPGTKSGKTAIESNGGIFATLGTEWNGKSVGNTSASFCASGELFSEVAQYDYANYYTKWVDYKGDAWTATDNGDGTMTIQLGTGDLAKYACKKLHIEVADERDMKASVDYQVPIIVKNSTDVTKSSLFNQHEKDVCKVCDVAIVAGGVLTKSTASPSDPDDRQQVYNVDVYAGGELYIPTGTEYTVNTLTVRSKGDEVGIVDVQGTLNRNVTTLIHSKRFHNVGNDWRYYYFSLPYDCNVSDITFNNGDPAVLGKDFGIDWYDGAHRASSQANGNWKSIAVHPTYPNVIKAGYGYTIAAEARDGHDNVTLKFPMANFNEIATELSVPVGNWGAGDDAVTVNHKGWNVVGNPFLTNYSAQEDLDINGELREGILVFENEEWTQTDNDINYATIPINGGKSGYAQEPLTNHSFKPFQSYIIQAGGDVEKNDLVVLLKNARKEKRSLMPIYRSESEYEAEPTTPVRVQVDLSNESGEKDKTVFIVSDRYKTEYEIGKDLVKWRGTSYKQYTLPVVASLTDGQELAFNAIPDSVAEQAIPVTFYTKKGCSMKFELSNRYKWDYLEAVILHDAEYDGLAHDLLTDGAYTFHTQAGENSHRFSISIRVNRKQNQNVTELKEIGTYKGDKPRKVLINGHVYIQRSGAIYDVTGKEVFNF